MREMSDTETSPLKNLGEVTNMDLAAEGAAKYTRLLAIVSWIGTVLFAGTIYGFASLQLMLEAEGALHDQCNLPEGDTKACAEQLADFSLVFTIGTSLQTFSSFIVGYAIDVYGPKLCLSVAGIMMSSSILLFASADLNSLWQYVTAITLSALSANVVYLSSFTVSFVVDPSFMSTYNTVNSCLFDTSSVMFFLFYLINLHLGCSFRQIFVGYFVLAVATFSALVYSWYLAEPVLIAKKAKLEPNSSKKVISRNATPTGSPIINTYANRDKPVSSTPDRTGYEQLTTDSERGEKPKPRSYSSGDPGTSGLEDGRAQDTRQQAVGSSGDSSLAPSYAGLMVGGEMITRVDEMHHIPWYLQIKTPQFGAVTAYAGLHLLRACSYMGNMENFLNSLGDEETGHFYTSVFSIVVPLGFLVIPLVDYVMFSNSFVSSLNIVTFLGAACGVVTCLNELNIQVIGFFVFCVFRALLYSVIGTFVAHTFGPLHGGRTNGVLWLLASILNFALFPMTKFILERADGDWQLLNLLLLLACVPAYLSVQLVLKPSVAAIAGAEKPARE